MSVQNRSWSVVVIESESLDGIRLYSPFTGVAADEDGSSADPSLVYAYIGDAGELMHTRHDAEAVVGTVLGDDAMANESQGSDAVADVVRAAERIAERLCTDLGVRTLTIVDPGGWGGVNAYCWEVGSVVDGEWRPSNRTIP